MSGVDEEFLHRLRATFELEANDHLQVITSNLVALEVGSGSDTSVEHIELMFRSAHSLKGAARAVALNDVESICQDLEGLFADWKGVDGVPDARALDRAHALVDQITGYLRAAMPDKEATGTSVSVRGGSGSGSLAAAQPSAGGQGRPASGPTVRVAVDALDSLLLLAEELIGTRLAAGQRSAELALVEEKLGLWRREWERARSQARSLVRNGETQGLGDFLDWSQAHLHLLENYIADQRRAAEQDRVATWRRIDDLLTSSKKMLMLPIGTLTAWLPKTVRDLTRDQGKLAEVQIQGEEVQIDKRILEELKDPLIHLLRNCVDHGIEPPDERRALGKPAQATISVEISALDEGQVEIIVRDDGRGIDVQALKSAALARRLMTADEAADLDGPAALQLVFLPDVSTSSVVTTLSGRGLGLAIVRENVERLGGAASVESSSGTGTLFRLRLPVTLAVFRGLIVGVAGRYNVLPVADVERVLRFQRQDVQMVEGRETIRVNGRVTPIVDLAQALGLGGTDRTGNFVSAVVLGGEQNAVAFAVDEVLDEQEVLAKQLGRPLHRLPYVAGITALGSGEPAPILKAAELLRFSSQVRGPFLQPAPVKVEPEGQPPVRILVAEDSLTSRLLLEAILQGAGYQVQTVIDGVEAYDQLRAEHYDLLVSDVEMPRLDGYGLTARIRADNRLHELPIILVTALESQEDRQRGLDAGANAYLAKSSFGQNNLLEAVRGLL